RMAGFFFSVQLSPDGKALLAATAWQGKLWEVATGKELAAFPTFGPAGFAPDGKTFVTADEGPPGASRRLRRADTGKEIRQPRMPFSTASSFAFPPDGKRLAASGQRYLDPTVHVWDLGTGEEFYPGVGHDAAVTGVAYAPDGRTLATWGPGGQVRVWAAS